MAAHTTAETTPVPSVAGEYATDDPAFWYNEANLEEFRIIGTDKKGGMAFYNLDGGDVLLLGWAPQYMSICAMVLN